MDLEQILDEHSEHLLRIAYYYTKSLHTAEDIVQDVFIKYLQSNYEENGKLQAYLTKMTINRCKDYLRSWAYRKIQLQEHLPIIPVLQKDRVIQKELTFSVGESVLSLQIKQREVIVLYYYEELNTAEIASLLKLPESTVRTRLRRARENLRPALSNEWEELYEK
ncbi:sigma-70 family RNA polymerase sigma factor [Solibacillus sp. FSL W7-1464]|uniref:sigma-70 family RNA polymerase sigma factor n=1 Tax=Solibacillus sp. FSL W7-1464 TaxID=2921706 RepID=UPI0030F51E2C